MRFIYLFLLFALISTGCKNSSKKKNNGNVSATEVSQDQNAQGNTQLGVDSSSVQVLQDQAYGNGTVPTAWLEKLPSELLDKLEKEEKEIVVTRVWEIAHGLYAMVFSLENESGFEEHLFTYKLNEGIKYSYMLSHQYGDASEDLEFRANEWLSDNSFSIISQDIMNGKLRERESTWVIQKTGDIIRPLSSFQPTTNLYSTTFLKNSPAQWTLSNDEIKTGNRVLGHFPTSLEVGEEYRFEAEDGFTLLMVKRLNYTTLAYFFRIKDRVMSGRADYNPKNVEEVVEVETSYGTRVIHNYTSISSTEPCFLGFDYFEADPNSEMETNGVVIHMDQSCSLNFAEGLELHIPISE